MKIKPPTLRSHSPWGWIDYVEKLAEGIYLVETPTHGGFWLDKSRTIQLPIDYVPFTGSKEWAEEDMDAPMLACLFDLPKANHKWCHDAARHLSGQTMKNWIAISKKLITEKTQTLIKKTRIQMEDSTYMRGWLHPKELGYDISDPLNNTAVILFGNSLFHISIIVGALNVLMDSFHELNKQENKPLKMSNQYICENKAHAFRIYDNALKSVESNRST